MLVPSMRARSQSNASMNLISIWATVSVVLFNYGSSGASPGSAPLVKLASYHIVKKPVHVVSDKFLSFTADPNTISHVAECDITNATLIMAKSLAPAYFRLAGFDSNRFLFQSNPNVTADRTSNSKTFSVSNSEWVELNDFLSRTGMNVIACVSGQTESSNQEWDLSNTLELITYSDKNNISLDWQLGYELQKVSSSGKLMGRDVTRLRKILDVFPRYRKSLIIGPDMTSFKSSNDAVFVRNYLTEAANSLDVFTWHPFSKKSEDDEITEMLANGMNSMETYLWIKEGLAKSTSKGVVARKSIWIAESENIQEASNMSDSMTWIIRMGAAARLGASVYLRTPRLMSFYEPTPEYWTAILYKSLVGRTVLDVRQTSGNGTNKVYMFAHCTKFIDKPDESIINPEISYDPGSITVYGVNMASESTRLSFKIGYKGDETAHIYLLTEDAGGNFPKTLLNKQPLDLSAENELPQISPRIRESPKYLLLPARSIFFVVFPNTKCRSCNEYDSPDASKSKAKLTEEEDQDTNTFGSNVLEVMEDENDRDSVYVRYPKRVETQQTAGADSKSSFGNEMDQSNPPMNVKYVTFSDETWLSPFPEKFKDVVSKEKDGTSEQKKSGLYRTLAQAMLGKRTGQNGAKEAPKVENPTTRFLFEDDSESNQFKRALNKSPGRFKRGSELGTVTVNETRPRDDSEESFDNGKDELESESPDDAEEQFGDTDDEKPKCGIFSTNKSEPEDDEVVPFDDEEIPASVSESANKTLANPAIDDETTDQRQKKIKRELPSENSVVPELPGNSTISSNNSAQISTEQETPSADVLLDNIMNDISQLIRKLFPLDSISHKSEQKLELGDIANRTRAKISRMLAKAVLNKLTLPDPSDESVRFENPTTRFVLKNDIQSDQFKEAVKNFDRFKRSPEFENFVKETVMEFKNTTEYEPRPIPTASSSDIDSPDIALYLFDQQDNETHSSETQKRSTQKIYAVPLSEENLQMAMQNPEFRETIPIITFVRKPTLEGMVEASKQRIKRETRSENSTIVESDISIASSTAPPIESSTRSDNEPVTQLGPLQTPSNRTKSIEDFSRSIFDEAGKLIQELLQNDAKNQSSVASVENLKLAKFSPELAKESDNSEVFRELREIDEDPESILGTRNLKPVDKPNTRPVSPFPKKPKNAKSKSAKNMKLKSAEDDVQLNLQTTSSSSSPSNEPTLSTKRQIPANVSSNLDKPTIATANLKSSDPENDSDKNSPAETQFQLAIKKNLQESSTADAQTKTKVYTAASVSSTNAEPPSSKDEQTLQNESESADDTVGKPLKKPSPADTARKMHAKQTKTRQPVKKPNPALDQLRRSNEQKRKELKQKHLALVNEIRNILGVPPLPETRLNKRDANVLDDWFKEGANTASDWWKDLKNWDPKKSWIAKETEKISGALSGRKRRQNDAADAEDHSSSLEIFKSNRPKRNSDIVVSPRTRKETPQEQQRLFIQARSEERRRQMEKIAEEKKAMKARAKDTQIHKRHRRDLQQAIEQIKQHRETKQTTIKEYRQKKAKHFEEIKQKISHLPGIARRNKRDAQTILDKIHNSKEQRQAQIDAFRQKLTKRAEELKQKLAHRQPIVPHRNKRDLQKIQDKIHELRKQKQDHRQDLRKKPAPEHPVEQPATPAPAKPKTKPVKIDEPRHQVNKTSKKSHKLASVKEKFHRVHKREENENQLEEKPTSPSDLRKELKLKFFVDPELNTPQSVLEDSKFDEVERLKRSISDNEIFDDDYETGAKIKNKDHDDYKDSKSNNKNILFQEYSTSTSNPINTKTGDSILKSFVSQDMSSQENQTCQLTNYNVFKYLLCVAHRLWYNYFNIN